MLVRESNEQDFLNLSALAIQVWLHTYATDGVRDAISGFVLSEFTPEVFRRIHESERQHILVAIRDGHLVGFVTVVLDSRCGVGGIEGFEVKTLYVQEHFHGMGIGTTLLDEVSRRYGESFWLTTWIKNTPAIGFYEAYGLTRVGIAYFHLEGEAHENVVLARRGGL